MKTKHIIMGLIILLLVIFFTQKKEHAGSTSTTTTTPTQTLSNEAVQNIAKVYADSTQMASFNIINITGELKIPKWRGMITMWSGSITSIPTGWALCDGTNGTPDLRGKFILGVGLGKDASNNNLTERRMGDVGGEEKHTIVIEEIPSHTHTYKVPGYNNTGENTWESTQDRNTNGMYTKNSGYVGGDKTITSAPGFDTGKPETWGTRPHNNMPPFYALAYIMKL